MGLALTKVDEPLTGHRAPAIDAVGQPLNPQRMRAMGIGSHFDDISVVDLEGDVVEVPPSYGDNQLGGDDFDRKIVDAHWST